MDDPYLQALIIRDMVAKRYGWSYAEVDKLTNIEMAVIFGSIEGEERFRKKEQAYQNMRNSMRK